MGAADSLTTFPSPAMTTGAELIRRELMERLVRAFDGGTLEDEIDRIPVSMRPRGGPCSRSSVWHDRAVLKYRLMALMGFSCEEETDEARTLRSYLEEMREAPPPRGDPLTVCAAGCDGCRERAFAVTDNCRGCFARPCAWNCPAQAVTVERMHASIDNARCVRCGKCAQACPYRAIVEVTVPCEAACPVGAIRKDANGQARIDFAKCIFCGACFGACPFSAIMEKSQLVQLLYALRGGEKITAVVAPSAAWQFPGDVGQLFAAILGLGFDDVVEVALGAERTTEHEAREFVERVKAGARLMTTSCCPSWTNLARKHIPQALPFVSGTPSPMAFAADIARERRPGNKVAFVGPCIAKRDEALRRGTVDYVVSFEELGAVFAARGIDPSALAAARLERPAREDARNYARSCGVTESVLQGLAGELPEGFRLDAKYVDGLDRRSVAQIRLYASGRLPCNFLEVMSCKGGCVSGPCSLRE